MHEYKFTHHLWVITTLGLIGPHLEYGLRKKESICLRVSTLRFLSSAVFFFFIDIDECAHGTHNCHSSRASCTNTVGFFSCSCNSAYTGDGRTCNLVSGNLQCAITGKRSLLKTFTPSLTVRKTSMRIKKIIY